MNENIFEDVDDVKGDVRIEVWGEGGRIHISLITEEGTRTTIYLRRGERLAQAILKDAWA